MDPRPGIKISTILIHIGGWLIFLILFIAASTPSQRNVMTLVLSPHIWIFYLTYIGVFYLHAFVLLPRLYFKKKFWLYCAVLVLLFAVPYFERPFEQLILRTQNTNPLGIPDPGRLPVLSGLPTLPPGAVLIRQPGAQPLHRPVLLDVFNFILFGLLLAMGAALYISREWARAQQKTVQAEALRANAELSFLKLQMNPHFLFNTLNTIYSLAITGGEGAADSILKLSGILRYLIDEMDNDFVSLENEIRTISDYLDLMRLRTDQNLDIDMIVTGDPAGKMIPPLLLMTFIENAFKYGVSHHEYSPIVIRIFPEPARIIFICENRLFAPHDLSNRNGVGIDNVRRRLEHLYPARHELVITQDSDTYRIYLVLN